VNGISHIKNGNGIYQDSLYCGNKSESEYSPNGIHIINRIGNQIPCSPLVVKRDRKCLQMRKKLPSKIAFNMAAVPYKKISPYKSQQESKNGQSTHKNNLSDNYPFGSLPGIKHIGNIAQYFRNAQ
jgi:hypothetical protein